MNRRITTMGSLIGICVLLLSFGTGFAQADWVGTHLCRTCAWCFPCHNDPTANASPIMTVINAPWIEQEGLVNDPGICIVDLHPQVTNITVTCIDVVPGFTGQVIWSGLPPRNQLPGFYIDTFGSNAIRVTATTQAAPGKEQVSGVVGHYCIAEWGGAGDERSKRNRPGPVSEAVAWDLSLWDLSFCGPRAGLAGVGQAVRAQAVAQGLLPAVAVAPFTLRAVLSPILGPTPPVSGIGVAALSGSGRAVVFSGAAAGNPNALFYVNANGSGLSEISLPATPDRGIREIVINWDGSRAFFSDGARQRIYRVEGGRAVEIFDAGQFDEINAVIQIRTTSDGDHVFFNEDRDDLWQLGYAGGAPMKVVDDASIHRADADGHHGWAIRDFDVSADGGVIAFVLDGYEDPDNYYGISSKQEVFVLDHGALRQLTDSADPALRTNVAVSGNGDTVVFSTNAPENSWYSVHADGSYLTLLEASASFGGVDLTYLGSQMIFREARAQVARLVNTNGSGGTDIFPLRGLQAPSELAISDSGETISFVQGGSLYIGRMDPTYVTGSEPVIHGISFDPPIVSRDQSDPLVVMSVQVGDPQGLEDISSIKTYVLLDGRLEGNVSNTPIRFDWDANDSGTAPDALAGDGIYTHLGRPSYAFDTVDEMTVRIVVTDRNGAFAIADAVLRIE